MVSLFKDLSYNKNAEKKQYENVSSDKEGRERSALLSLCFFSFFRLLFLLWSAAEHAEEDTLDKGSTHHPEQLALDHIGLPTLPSSQCHL